MKKTKVKSKKNVYIYRSKFNPMLLPVLTIGILLILAFLVSSAVLTSQITLPSSAAKKAAIGCNLSCSSDKDCAVGTTCTKTKSTDKKGLCLCGYGTNCIIGEKAKRDCMVPLGQAKEFDYCDHRSTVRANRRLPDASVAVACGYGVECKHVVRLTGGSYFMCCDPKNPTNDPRCISDDIRRVAPRP